MRQVGISGYATRKHGSDVEWPQLQLCLQLHMRGLRPCQQRQHSPRQQRATKS